MAGNEQKPGRSLNKGSHASMHTTHLAVANLGVPVSIGCQHPPQGSNTRFVLEGRVLRQRTVQVPLYLLCHQAASAQRLLHQISIVPRVRGEVCHSV